MTQFNDRFQRQAEADYTGFTEAVHARYGFSPVNTKRLLELAGRLGATEGYALKASDAALLKELHPGTHPGDIDAMVSALNAEPARTRQDLFIGVLAADTNTMRGDVHLASDATKHVKAMVYESEVQDIADKINAKRGGSEDARPAWKAPTGSVRDIIEQQVKGSVQRDFEERYERDDPDALHAAKWMAAETLDNSRARLDNSDNLSAREVLSAAYDNAAAETFAEEHFGVDGTT